MIDDSTLRHRHTHRWHLCLILIWHGHLIGYERHLHHRVIGRLHEIRWRLHLRLLRAFYHILCATTATLVVALTGIRLETHPACVHLIVVTGVRTHLVRVESTLVLLILAAPLRDSLTRRGSLHKTLARGVHWRSVLVGHLEVVGRLGLVEVATMVRLFETTGGEVFHCGVHLWSPSVLALRLEVS